MAARLRALATKMLTISKLLKIFEIYKTRFFQYNLESEMECILLTRFADM